MSQPLNSKLEFPDWLPEKHDVETVGISLFGGGGNRRRGGVRGSRVWIPLALVVCGAYAWFQGDLDWLMPKHITPATAKAGKGVLGLVGAEPVHGCGQVTLAHADTGPFTWTVELDGKKYTVTGDRQILGPTIDMPGRPKLLDQHVPSGDTELVKAGNNVDVASHEQGAFELPGDKVALVEDIQVNKIGDTDSNALGLAASVCTRAAAESAYGVSTQG